MLRVVQSLRRYSDAELARLHLRGLVYEQDGFLLPAVAGGVGTVKVGQPVAQANTDLMNTDSKLAIQVTPVVGALYRGWAYIDGNGTGTGNQAVRFIVYSDTGANLPNAKLAVSADVTITDGQAFGWVPFDISPALAITSTAKIWIGLHNGAIATPQLKRTTVGTAEAQLPSGDLFTDGSEAVWSGTGHPPSQPNYSIYAEIDTGRAKIIVGGASQTVIRAATR